MGELPASQRRGWLKKGTGNSLEGEKCEFRHGTGQGKRRSQWPQSTWRSKGNLREDSSETRFGHKRKKKDGSEKEGKIEGLPIPRQRNAGQAVKSSKGGRPSRNSG